MAAPILLLKQLGLGLGPGSRTQELTRTTYQDETTATLRLFLPGRRTTGRTTTRISATIDNNQPIRTTTANFSNQDDYHDYHDNHDNPDHHQGLGNNRQQPNH